MLNTTRGSCWVRLLTTFCVITLTVCAVREARGAETAAMSSSAEFGPDTSPEMLADGGVEVLMLVDTSPPPGSIGAQRVFRTLISTYTAMSAGDRLSIWAATRYPTEVLSIRKAEGDRADAILDHIWKEKVLPLAERSVDPSGGLARLVGEGQERRPDLVVVLVTTPMKAAEVNAAWQASKAARDRSGALVVLAGPLDGGLQRAAESGVFTFVQMDEARPASWLEEVRRRKHRTDAVASELERLRAENHELVTTGQRLETERNQARTDGTRIANERDRAVEESRQAADRERAAGEREQAVRAEADAARADAAEARKSLEAQAAQIGTLSVAQGDQSRTLVATQHLLAQEQSARASAEQRAMTAVARFRELEVQVGQTEDREGATRAELQRLQVLLDHAQSTSPGDDQSLQSIPTTSTEVSVTDSAPLPARVSPSDNLPKSNAMWIVAPIAVAVVGSLGVMLIIRVRQRHRPLWLRVQTSAGEQTCFASAGEALVLNAGGILGAEAEALAPDDRPLILNSRGRPVLAVPEAAAVVHVNGIAVDRDGSRRRLHVGDVLEVVDLAARIAITSIDQEQAELAVA